MQLMYNLQQKFAQGNQNIPSLDAYRERTRKLQRVHQFIHTKIVENWKYYGS